MDAESAAVAQHLGWYARAFRQPKAAADWFTTALEWEPANEPAAFGLALARQDLGDAAGVEALVADWGAALATDRRTRPRGHSISRTPQGGAKGN